MQFSKLFIFFILCVSTMVEANTTTVGNITAVQGSSNIQRDLKEIKVELGADLQAQDKVLTYENTKVQIIFKDDTIISIGKNSIFSIEEYLYDEENTPAAKFQMLRGAMRTITGKIGKISPQKFKVQTKTATIGIRGTNFSILVEEDDSMLVYCTYGEVSVNLNEEEHSVRQGYYAKVSKDGKVSVVSFSASDLKQMRKKYFSFNPIASKKVLNEDELSEKMNQQQLNVTVDDESGLLISDVNDVNSDNIQRLENTTFLENISPLSFEGLLASYSMTNASYSGTYSTVSGTTSLGTAGAATLMVNFGADTINLDLGGLIVYSTGATFSATGFTVLQDDLPTESASGTFQAPTGNTVTGTFSVNDGNIDIGNFNVNTAQELQ